MEWLILPALVLVALAISVSWDPAMQLKMWVERNRSSKIAPWKHNGWGKD